MTAYVSMMQSGLPFSFTTHFSSADAEKIRHAVVGVKFDLEKGFGLRDDTPDITLTLKSPGGQRMYNLDYVELCRQLSTSVSE